MNLSLTNKRATALYYITAFSLIPILPTATIALIIAAVIVHVIVISMFSAITHRYFCHRAYETNPTLAWILSLIPIAYGYSSPISWAHMHTSHHAYADTDKDPHVNGWRGLFTATYKQPLTSFKKAISWFVNRKHTNSHSYALVIMLVWALILLSISPLAFAWLYVVPVFTLKLGDGLHRAISHKDYKAQNRWYLEYVIPMGGEWIHDEHHENAKKPKYSNKWYELDWGWFIIKTIRHVN